MKELAGEADESLAIDFDVDVAGSELESEAVSTAGGGVLLPSPSQHSLHLTPFHACFKILL